jgi:hypothetical protein
MRACLGGILAVTVLAAWAGGGRADDQAEALKIVDAAIQAAGGAAKLDKLKTAALKGKGTLHGGDQEVGTFTIDATVHGFDRCRLEFDATIMDRNQKILLVFNGDKGWAKRDDRVEDAPAEAVQVIKPEMYAVRSAQMLTPLKDKEVKLSPLGEMKINDRAAVGIKVVKKDQPDMDLYFDKETHLPVKCELRVKERNDMEVTTAWFFSEFKELGGVKHPVKIVLTREDKKMMEMEITELKAETKVDEKTFEKP